MRKLSQSSFHHARALLAALLVGMVLLLDAMAACPALHELIHKDANRPDHDCAVTMFAQGKVDSAAGEILVILTGVPIAAAAQAEFSVFRPAIEHLPLGRAPPLSVFVS